MTRRWPAAIAVAALASPATAQLLQDAPTVVVPPPPPITHGPTAFDRNADIGVVERMLPAFSAQGVRVGAFDVYPGLAIGGLYTANVFENNADRHSDVALVIRPEVTVRTSAGPYLLTAYGRGDIRRYAHYGSENTEEGLGGLAGSVAVGAHSTISAGVNYGALIEPRFASDSPINAARPLSYTDLNGFAGATIEGASTRLILRGDVDRLRFGDTPAIGGGTLFTRDRDRARYSGLARVERALSPAVSIYAAATGNRIDYRLPIPGVGTRDSSGFGIYAGSSFQATALLRGDIRLGYLRQNFDLAGIRPISGLGALGTLVYFPNRLWTVTASGESSVQDSGVPGTGGYLHRGGSIRMDHELRRYIVASFGGGYFRDTYRGLPRRDDLPFADASLTYLSRNHWNARLGYRYIARNCTCSIGVTDFDDHRVSLALTFQT